MHHATINYAASQASIFYLMLFFLIACEYSLDDLF